MKRPPNPRVLALLIALGLVLGVGGGVTYAAFSSITSNSGNSFSSAADWVPPSASAAVIAKTTPGFLVGTIRQGGTYYVYANATDSGNPPSGISTITANVSTITTGLTNLALTSVGGPFSVGGVSYSYRSASTTANNPLAAGPYTFSLTLTDVAANSQTQTGFSVTVDNTAPAGLDVQTTNVGPTPGKAETGDIITFTYTKQIDPGTILTGWTGAATTVTVRLRNNFSSPPPQDVIEVWDSTNTVLSNLGSLNLQRKDYVSGGDVSFTSSTIVQSGATITVTLGIPGGAGVLGTAAGTGNMTWAPLAATTDAAGNPCSTATITQSGPPNLHF